MIAASFGTFGLIWSATARDWALAASAVSWAKGGGNESGDHLPPLLPAWGSVARSR
jgi:hypothetical protein